jgi:ribonuclease HI
MERVTYEFVRQKDNVVVMQMTEEWSVVQAALKKMPGHIARKVKAQYLKFVPKPGAMVYCVDAWTEGNPGIGGCRVMKLVDNGSWIVMNHWDTIKHTHSNNFYELVAIGLGVKTAGESCQNLAESLVYSDSTTAISWISKGTHDASADQDRITGMIRRIGSMLVTYRNIKVVKWDSSVYGEIPADYGRK